MVQWRLDGAAVDAVAIGAAFTAMAEMISRILQLGNDTLHCAFGNTNPIGKVAHPHLRLLLNAEQHMGVVG